MKTVTSRELQTRFGEISDTVKAGEPVAVTHYGKPAMMLVPYEMGEEMVREMHARKMDELLASLEPLPVFVPELSDEEIGEMVAGAYHAG